ncbi:hypothetical protein B0I35DRAFT_27471 [Stachybotrys elegans]|uniref:Uncharacterized protein n=1 Tax=Stachybotrys elegans TaxID=80388 RepID=A0A8K0T4S3_9HYPO|nr:hypothetical protein B0I35DRAFT_27471 [Stachybotrys elegans]
MHICFRFQFLLCQRCNGKFPLAVQWVRRRVPRFISPFLNFFSPSNVTQQLLAWPPVRQNQGSIPCKRSEQHSGWPPRPSEPFQVLCETNPILAFSSTQVHRHNPSLHVANVLTTAVGLDLDYVECFFPCHCQRRCPVMTRSPCQQRGGNRQPPLLINQQASQFIGTVLAVFSHRPGSWEGLGGQLASSDSITPSGSVCLSQSRTWFRSYGDTTLQPQVTFPRSAFLFL